MNESLHVDAVIFGGGAAGLWTLDRLVARGYQVILLEAHELGSGQTVASQGIIHGGLKYTLGGILTSSAEAIRDMPQRWRECLAGQREPTLTSTQVRSPCCYLWRTESLASRLGMLGARAGLRTATTVVEEDARPPALANCPGIVARVDEQVIDTVSFISDLFQRHRDRILKFDMDRMEMNIAGDHCSIMLRDKRELTIRADRVVLTAGSGNAELRSRMRLDSSIMQRRPLHMVMVRGGNLPALFGHCVDGSKTRVTITSAADSAGRTVWQIGGQVAEDGVTMEPSQLMEHAKTELNNSLADFDLGDVEWATYRVDRAESSAGGRRPENLSVIVDDNVITAWPTKLALAPALAECIVSEIDRAKPHAKQTIDESTFKDWPRPTVAQPPWETATQWFAGR